MRFLFWLGNHSAMGQRSLEDVIGIIGHQMRALGHEAVWDSANEKFLGTGGGYNVVVEGFNDPAVRVLADAHGQGARFICIATEEPTPKGFNWGVQKEMTMRQEWFGNAAPYLDGIIHLVPGEYTSNWYSQWAPTAYTELGYAPSLIRKETKKEPEFDFGFFGSFSPRRKRMLTKLAKMTNKAKAVRLVTDFATQNDRDRIMQECKVVLQIRKFEEMGLVSSSRCVTSLCLGRPILAEPHDLSYPWNGIVKFAKSEDEFYTMALMARGAWRQIHNDQFSKFKTNLTPQGCIGEALHKIGVT